MAAPLRAPASSNLLSVFTGMTDWKLDRDLRAAKAESLRHAMAQSDQQMQLDQQNLAQAQAYAAQMGLDPNATNVAINNPGLYNTLNRRPTGGLNANQQMQLADRSLTDVMQAIENMGASEEYPGGGVLYQGDQDFELFSPGTWFDSQQSAYDVEGTDANPIYNANPEALDWAFKGGAGTGQSRMERMAQIAAQIQNSMKRNDPSSMGFMPQFQNMVTSATGGTGQITDYPELIRALQELLGRQTGGGVAPPMSAQQQNAAYVNRQ
jgi:hypothetical protein